MIGWIGSFCFAFCGLPQVIQCYKQGHARGVSLSFILFWLLGEVCCIYATITELGFVPWLLFNYIACLIFTLILLYYKVIR